MEEKLLLEIHQMFETLVNQTSDREAFLSNLSKARLHITQTIDQINLNRRWDINDNWGNKVKDLEIQADKLDSLIIEVSKLLPNSQKNIRKS